MEKIAVLTSGGDSPGMNAAIRGVVRCANYSNIEIYAVNGGFDGLIKGQLNRMDSRSVSDIIQRGGTILKTARSEEFKTEEGVKKAGEILRAYGIEGLVVIGGDGSFRGMKDLFDICGISCVGIPGTIDNDLGYTDYTIGFDTAVNTVVDAINKLRDTMTSHNRACIVEVMGRRCGDIALYSGISGGAESIIVPEHKYDIEQITAKMKKNIIKGKVSDIIVLAEGVCTCTELKAAIQEKIDLMIRTVKLGYIQRGGSPTVRDRIFAARCADRAVGMLKSDLKGCRVVGIKNNNMIDMDIVEALNTPKVFDEELYNIATRLAY